MAEEQLHYGEDYRFIPAMSAASGLGVSVLPDL